TQGENDEEEELCCPVCQDYFRDPVLLQCSHSVCNACVQQWWAIKRARECPVCRTKCAKASPPRNLVLKNLCEAFLLELESGVYCRLHAEKLKLYCLDHCTPVCVVCRYSTDHQNHKFTPVEEAAALGRNGLKETLEALRGKLKLFNEMKVNLERTCEVIKTQAVETENEIKAQFKLLQAFLRKEELDRIYELKKEEEQKIDKLSDKIAVLNTQFCDLESTIKAIEKGLKDADASFLLQVDSLTNAARRPLPVDTEVIKAPLIDVARHLGNMSFRVWCNMKESVSYTPVILNPNTAHLDLGLSEDLTIVNCATLVQSCPRQPPVMDPNQPERMVHHRSVLGSVGFIFGSHTWDIKTGGSLVWALGVLAQQAHRKGDIQSGLWMVRFCHGKFTAFSPSQPKLVLPLKNTFARVRVHLDCDKGKLSFSDPDTNVIIHTFTHTFTDKMFPYVNTWSDVPLTILPKVLSVTVS
uniref:Tripartite motif containing 35-13 n=1 Tax=Mola mola TaxID=94237 RepID=A0A3Q3VVU4_MOLML